MSPSWRDRIDVFFAPDRVDLVRFPRGIKRQPGNRLWSECEFKPGIPAWASSLEQLERMIADAVGAEMTVTVSNSFVRYAVLAAQKNISSLAELEAFAAFQMREIYGERTAAWVISVGAWNPGKGGVCAGIERSLFEGLEECAGRHKIRLKYVEPYLTGAFDHWYKQFGDSRAWFALIETGRLCLVLLEHSIWQRVSNQRVLHNAQEELLAALDQEALFSGHKKAIEAVYLYAPAHPTLALPDDCGWHVAHLHTQNAPPVPLHYPHYPSTAAAVTAGVS